ncbi:MAG TPA: 2-phosphosulfolactate phosphatase [Pirellulaceae bacterium]|nr:2-phosphosulfolactate phosphatase [Pirellulaceae bacterium]
MTQPRQVDVYLLPSLVEPQELAGKLVVVVDILRATTTIVHALAAGAVQVVPCLEIDEARRLAGEFAGPALLGGERSGGKIPGFDLGNSPQEYTPASVGGKTLVFTTTNGTQALARCRAARRVLLGAFINLSAMCRELAGEDHVTVVCAGTNGQVTREDALFAGALADELTAAGKWTLNDQGQIVRDAWRSAAANLVADPLSRTLRSSKGGRNLIGIGHENDIALAAEIDKFDLVPELDLATWRIRPA